MAKKQTIQNISQLWDALGTFWGQFPDKDLFEKIWTEYRNVSKEFLRRRYQLYLSKYIERMPGILDRTGETFLVVDSGDNKNTFLTDSKTSIKTENYLASIPKLEGLETAQILSEDTDYTVQDTTRLQFLTSLSFDSASIGVENRVTLYADNSYYHNPVLWEIYASGIDMELSTLENEYYVPPETITVSNIEKTKKYAKHLKYVIWGLFETQSKSPTITSLKTAFGISRGLPFTYHAGTIDSIQGSTINILISGTTSSYDAYEMPAGLNYTVSQGDTVERFDLLCSGVEVYDWVNNQSFIENLADVNQFNLTSRIAFEYDQTVKDLSHDTDFHARYIKNLVPDSLTYSIEEK